MSANQRLRLALDHLKKSGKISAWKEIAPIIGGDKNRVSYLTKLENGGELKGSEPSMLKKQYPEINWDWVTSGEGKMLKEYPDGKTSDPVKEPPTIYGVPAGELNEKETEIIRIVMGTSEMSCNDQLALMREAWLFQNNKITKYAELIEKL